MKTLKKYLISLSVIVMLSENVVSYAQSSVNLSDIEMVNLGDNQLYAHKRGNYDSPVTGKIRIMTGVTTEYIDAEFKNGFAAGKWQYFDNNKKTIEMNYLNGYLDGEYIKYYSGGDVEFKGRYLKGQKHGKWETFKSDGTIKLTEVFANDDMTKKITYYADGSVDRERNYKNGKEHGIDKQYTSEGKLKAENNYVNGKQVGAQMKFYASNAGNYIERCNYNAQGKLDGMFTETFEENGAVKKKGQYKDGRKVGRWTYGYLSGLYKEEEYKDGKLIETNQLKK